jgi:hypothetical protein
VVPNLSGRNPLTPQIISGDASIACVFCPSGAIIRGIKRRAFLLKRIKTPFFSGGLEFYLQNR